MRVNHAGEVSAQGLYIGHAILAKTNDQKEMMLRMASEEKDHLEWCEKRIKELKGNTSIFNPVWFSGSIAKSAAPVPWSIKRMCSQFFPPFLG